MANDSYTQQALAADPRFHTRLRSIVSFVAWAIIGEADTVEYHDEREKYARQVTNQVDMYARQFAPWLVTRPALLNAETSFNFPANAVVTAADDVSIIGQLSADWNDLAGIPAPPATVPGGPATFAMPAGPLPIRSEAAPAPPVAPSDKVPPVAATKTKG